MKTINIGIDKVSLYNYDKFNNKVPTDAIPAGWPEVRSLNNINPLFSLTEQEVFEKYRVKFPIDIDELKLTHTEKEVSDIVKYCGQLDFERNLINSDIQVRKDTVTNLVKNKIPFLYIIKCTANLWYGRKVPLLRDNILDAISKNLCTVVFCYELEGDINHTSRIDFLLELGKVNGLNKETYIVTHGNLKLQELLKQVEETGTEINFRYLPSIFFESHPIFTPSPSMLETKKVTLENSKNFSQENIQKDCKKHFNLLNRRPHRHRVLLFTEIMSTPELKKSTSISLGAFSNVPNRDAIKWVKEAQESIPAFRANYEFALTHNFEKPTILDRDFKDNLALTFNRDIYKQTFCSVITETQVDERTIFFSEKIFKPIFNLHPFILLGNPNSLKKLKELGYKTFDKWWDESYDSEINYLKRIKMISKIMLEVSSWSLDKCNTVTQEMQDIFQHNYNNFLNNTRRKSFIEDIYNAQYTTTK